MASAVKTIEESLGSSPGKFKKPESGVDLEEQQVSTGKKFQMRSQSEQAFKQFAVADELSAGNQAYTINQKERGLLGLFRSRDRIIAKPVTVELDPLAYHNAVSSTIYDFLRTKQDPLNDQEIEARSRKYGGILADGVSVMTYMKIRNIVISEFQDNYTANNLKRPRVDNDLVIPLPFAFAIQQLGIVHVVDTQLEIKLAPVYPDAGHTYGLPEPRKWSPYAYYEAVNYAKRLGMQFGIVDLKEKKGTAWWLLKPYCSDNFFELRCILPETNYTSTMALVYALFLPSDPNKAAAVTLFDTRNYFLFDTTLRDDQFFGTMMRQPHIGINLTAFEAIIGVESSKCERTFN